MKTDDHEEKGKIVNDDDDKEQEGIEIKTSYNSKIFLLPGNTLKFYTMA